MLDAKHNVENMIVMKGSKLSTLWERAEKFQNVITYRVSLQCVFISIELRMATLLHTMAITILSIVRL